MTALPCGSLPLWQIGPVVRASHLAEREIMVTVPSDRTGDKVIRLSSYDSNRGHPGDATSPFNRSDAKQRGSHQDEKSLTQGASDKGRAFRPPRAPHLVGSPAAAPPPPNVQHRQDEGRGGGRRNRVMWHDWRSGGVEMRIFRNRRHRKRKGSAHERNPRRQTQAFGRAARRRSPHARAVTRQDLSSRPVTAAACRNRPTGAREKGAAFRRASRR